ncbi:hypothetical protein FR819_13130 [Leclercia adecarboxylata]|nr:hypothetical protein FR819_13130 [Leclercia adecarboxylata]
MTVRRCNKPDKTPFSARIPAESWCHSPDCMVIWANEIYQAQAARFNGEFIANFTRLKRHSRRTRPGRCR